LEEEGHQFFSDTDTEVVLAAYKQWGKSCLDKFIGMFAFLIADLEKKTAFVVRDHLGIKPLFMYEDSDYYIFCSEIKALLPYCQLEPDFSALNEYLVFRYVLGSRTLFKGVISLVPGSFREFHEGILDEPCQFFNLADTLSPNYQRSFSETCEEVETALKESVKIHLRSDVELGVQLSGGVDSSLVTALTSQQVGRKLHSFSISFGEDEYDESKYQKYVSEKYNTEHHD